LKETVTMSTLRETRMSAGVSLMMAAALAGVSVGTARLFEASPEAVADPRRRARLLDVYACFSATQAAPAAAAR
jgi:hypothetical protein